MHVFSFFQESVRPIPISIEIHTRFQIPSFQILGLPAPEIQEARERIMAAFSACEFEFPKKKVIMNLAPSALRKSGTGHDLAIAVRVLESTLDLNWPERIYAWGELGLTGEIKSCGKTANLIELLLTDRQPSTLLLSSEDTVALHSYLKWRQNNGLANPRNIKIKTVTSLRDVPSAIEDQGNEFSLTQMTSAPLGVKEPTLLPLAPELERMIEIAVTGRHHLLLLGPKGVGKSQALEWLKAITPPSTPEQTWIRILYEESRNSEPSFETPIRQVHAQVKPSALLGSYNIKGFRAGELSLAHGGLLIADEFMEWPRDAKECLREPLQSKQVVLTRVLGQCALPCDIQLIATGNLCRCGGVPATMRGLLKLDSKKFRCRCRPIEAEEYLQKLSGPIADRIDLIHLHSSLPDSKKPPTSAHLLKERIRKSREFAMRNFSALPSELGVEFLERSIAGNPKIEVILSRLPSLRARHKTLRVAHTLQSIEKTSTLKIEHVFEAAAMRFMDQLNDSKGN